MGVLVVPFDGDEPSPIRLNSSCDAHRGHCRSLVGDDARPGDVIVESPLGTDEDPDDADQDHQTERGGDKWERQFERGHQGQERREHQRHSQRVAPSRGGRALGRHHPEPRHRQPAVRARQSYDDNGQRETHCGDDPRAGLVGIKLNEQRSVSRKNRVTPTE